MEPHAPPDTPPPVASLVAVTDEAKRALAGQANMRIASFPFRVGRESRTAPSPHPVSEDLRIDIVPQLNDAYLIEQRRKHLHISREHFAIEYAAGKFFLLDRGSSCGTIVAGRSIGGDRAGGQTELRSGDEIVVGANTSPFVFRFEIVAD